MARSEGIAKAVQGLKDEEHRLEQALEALQAQEKALAVELKRVRSALQTLNDASPSDRPEPKGTMSREMVREIALQSLKASGAVPLPKLKDEVLRQGKARGLSGTGIHRVLLRVL